MEDQPRVLQQWVEITPFCGSWQQTLKRIGGQKYERHQTDGDQAKHAKHARHDHIGQGAGKGRNRDAPTGQH